MISFTRGTSSSLTPCSPTEKEDSFVLLSNLGEEEGGRKEAGRKEEKEEREGGRREKEEGEREGGGREEEERTSNSGME